MTDVEFLLKIARLKRLGWLALLGAALICTAFLLGDDAAHPYEALAGIGAICLVPVIFYLVILTIWHWKGRYRGTHSNLWGALLVLETSGWCKIVYLFRHVLPDARKSGRYAGSGA